MRFLHYPHKNLSQIFNGSMNSHVHVSLRLEVWNYMLHNRENLRIYNLDDDFVAIVEFFKNQKHNMKAESGFTCNNRTPWSLYNNINVCTMRPSYHPTRLLLSALHIHIPYIIQWNHKMIEHIYITFSPLLYIWLTYWYLTYKYKNTVQIQTTICIAVCWPKQWRISSFIFGAESTWQPVRPLLTRNFAFK